MYMYIERESLRGTINNRAGQRREKGRRIGWRVVYELDKTSLNEKCLHKCAIFFFFYGYVARRVT